MTKRITHRKKKSKTTKNRVNSDPNVLSPSQHAFLAEYFRSDNVTRSAEKSGVPHRTAKRWMTTPLFKKEIEKRKAELRDAAKYGLKQAMQECQDAIDFARQTENANAYVKGVELKTKLNGLLIEKHDHRMAANFSIQIEGVREPAMIPPTTSTPPIPIDVTEVKPDLKQLAQGAVEDSAINKPSEAEDLL